MIQLLHRKYNFFVLFYRENGFHTTINIRNYVSSHLFSDSHGKILPQPALAQQLEITYLPKPIGTPIIIFPTITDLMSLVRISISRLTLTLQIPRHTLTPP